MKKSTLTHIVGTEALETATLPDCVKGSDKILKKQTNKKNMSEARRPVANNILN